MTDTAPEAQPSSVETPDERRLFLKQMLTAVGTALPLSALGALGASTAARASDCDPNTQSCPPGPGKSVLRTGAVISADGDRIRSMMTELESRRTAGKREPRVRGASHQDAPRGQCRPAPGDGAI